MSEQEPSAEEAETKPAEAEAPVAPEADVPKKKTKKKTKSEAEATPADPRALELATAFDAGNFVRVRELGQELSKSDEPALAAIGRDYLARIAVDPIQIAFLGICAVALLTIAWIYVPH